MQDEETLRNKSESACKTGDFKPRGVYDWVDYYQKNKPQTNALGAGLMVIAYGGQHLAWGIFNNHLLAQPWAGGYEDDGTVFWAIITWFIAAIVGFIVGAIVVNRFTKMGIYTIASFIAATSAVLLIIGSESIYYIFPSRFLAGLSYGIVYLTVLIHAGEVSVPRMRGLVVSLVHFCLFIGVFMMSSGLLPVHATKIHAVDPTKTMGTSGLICIVTGVLIAILLNRESPVFLIKKYRDDDAIKSMISLRTESHETTDVRQDFHEFKLMVMEDARSNLNIFDKQNRWPLFMILLLKIGFVASFNLPLNIVWLESVETDLYDGITDPSGMYLSGTRWVVMMVMMFFVDFKRIKFYTISTGALSVIIFIIIMADESKHIIKINECLGFVFQAFSGIAVGMMADIYSTEAFNTRKKPLSIAFLSILEFGLQIVFVVIFFYFERLYFETLIVCASILALGLLVYFIPDTSNMSLRNARMKFNS